MRETAKMHRTSVRSNVTCTCARHGTRLVAIDAAARGLVCAHVDAPFFLWYDRCQGGVIHYLTNPNLLGTLRALRLKPLADVEVAGGSSKRSAWCRHGARGGGGRRGVCAFGLCNAAHLRLVGCMGRL